MANSRTNDQLPQVFTVERLAQIVHEDIGVTVDVDDFDTPLDDIVGWDSVHLLAVVASAERCANVSVSFPDLLIAQTLNDVFRAVVGVTQ